MNDRLKQMSAKPCIACRLHGAAQPNRTEVHHIVDRGYRKHSGGHESTIPLCQWHHRGVCLDGYTGTQMTEKWGPSMALAKRDFVRTYGTERELLKLVNDGYPLDADTLF